MICIQNLQRKIDEIGNALPWFVPARPQFEIFRTVIIANSIFVVDRFGMSDSPAKNFFHHQDMLRHVPILTSARMIGHPNENVTVFRSEAFSISRTLTNRGISMRFPSAVVLAAHSASKSLILAATNPALLFFFRSNVQGIAISPKFAKMSSAMSKRTIHRGYWRERARDVIEQVLAATAGELPSTVKLAWLAEIKYRMEER